MSSKGGGGGGRNLSVLFSILGIDEAKAKLEGLAPSFDKLAAASKKTGDEITKSLPDAAKFAPVTAGIDKTKTSLDTLGASSTKVSGEITKLKTTTDQVGASTTKASGEVTKFKASTDQVGASTSKASGEITKLKTSEDQLAASSTKAAGETTKFKQSQDQLAGTGSKVGAELDKEKKAMTGVEQEGKKVVKTTQDLKKESATLATETNKVETELKQTKEAIKGVGDESKKSSEGIKKVGDEIDKTNVKTKETSANTQTLKANFTTLATGVTTLGSGLVSLWQTYDSLGDAQLRVDQVSLKLSKSEEALAKAREKLNQLIAEGVTSGAAYEQAVLDVNQGEEMLAVTTGKLTNAQEDLNITQANFSMQILPQVITVLGSLGTVFTAGTAAMELFKKKTGETTLQLGIMDKAMKFMSISNPFFLALTIGGSVLAAFVLNLGGFRDMINGVGVALGNALPFLKPFLTMIGDLGKGLLNMLGMGGEAATAFGAEVDDGMTTASTAIEGVANTTNRTVGDLKRYGVDVSNVFINAKGEVEGFKVNFQTAEQAIVSSTANIATGTGSNVDTAIQHLGRLKDEYLKVSKDLEDMFSKTIDLGSGIKLSGVSKLTKHTASNLGTESSDRYKNSASGFEGASHQTIANMQKLTETTTFYNAATKELHFNLDELTADFVRNKFSVGEAEAILKVLNGSMKGVAETTSRNISMLPILQKQLDLVAFGAEVGAGKINTQTMALTGMTGAIVGVTSMLPATAGHILDVSDGIAKLTDTTTANTGATTENAGALADNSKSKDNAAVSTSIFAAANQRLTADMQAVVAETQYLTVATSDNAAMLTIATMGTMKQQNALKQQQLTLIENVSGLNEYNKQLGTTEGKMTAVYTGMAKQLDIFVKNKAAMFENVGVLAELNKQFETGEPQLIAYATAYHQAFIDMTNSQIAISGLRGEIGALEEMIATGEADLTAFAEAFLTTKKNVLEAKVGLSSLKAELAALAKSYFEVNKTQDDINKGTLEAEKNFLALVEETNNLTGSTKRYIELVESGAIIQLEYTKAFRETKVAIADTKVELARAGAEYDAFSQSILDTEDATARANLAFMEGKRSIQDWYMAAQTATDNTAGMYWELRELAGPLGGIPPLIDGNIEAMKNWIAIQKGFPQAVQEGLGKAADLIDETLGKIHEAYKTNNNLNKKEMDELFGINLPDKLEKTIEIDANFTINEQAHAEKLNNVVNAMFRSAELGQLDDATKKETGKRFMDSMGDALDKGEISQGFYDKVQGIFDSMPSPSNTAAWNTFKASWADLTAALEKGDWKTAENILATIGADRSSSINANAAGANAMADAIAAISTKYGEMPTDAEIREKAAALKELAFAPGGSLEQVMTATPGGTYTQPTEGVDSGEVDTAQQKLDNYKAALDGLPAVVATAVTNSNVEFDKLNPAGVGFQANVQIFGEVLNTMPQAVNLAVANTNVEFDLINPAGPGFQANVQVFGTVLATMGPATKVAVDAVNVELGLLGTPLTATVLPAFDNFATSVQTGPFNKIQVDAQTASANVVKKFTTEIPKIFTPFAKVANDLSGAQGPWQKMQNDATKTAQGITRTFQTEAPKIGTAIQGGTNAAIQRFGELKNAATSVMTSIIQSTSNAQDAVRNLVGEIGNLQDKTITITTVFETVGSPASAATGFGPAVVDHPMQLTVGESGPEYVAVMPLSTSGGKFMTAEQRLHEFADPNRERNPNKNYTMMYMAAGNVPVGATQLQNNSNVVDVRIVGVGTKSITDALPVEGTAAGGTLLVASSGGGGGGNGSVGSGGGSGQQFGNSNNNNNNNGGNMPSTATGNGTFGGGSNSTASGEESTAGGSTTNTASGGSDWSHVQTSGGQKWTTSPEGEITATEMTDPDKKGKWKLVDSKGKNVAANFNSKEEADRYNEEVIKGNPPAGGGGGNGGGNNGGGGGSTQQQSNPNNWTLRSIEGGTYDITDEEGQVVARGFRSQIEAEKYKQAHIDAWEENENLPYKGPAGPGEEFDTYGGQYDSDDAVYQAPRHIKRGPGGGMISGTPNGGGGNNGGGTPNEPSPYAGTTTGGVPYYAGSPDTSNMRLNAKATIKFHDGSKMDLRPWNELPESERKERMHDIKTIPYGYALYEDGTIARSPYFGPDNDSGLPPAQTPGGGGNNGGGDGGGGTPNGGWQHGAGNVNSSAAPYDVASIQTSGSGKRWQGANPDPDTWKVVPMIDDPSKWKVVDDKDKNIATGFTEEDQAGTYIEEYQAIKAGNLPNQGGNNGGGGGGGQTPNNPPAGGGMIPGNVKPEDLELLTLKSTGEPLFKDLDPTVDVPLIDARGSGAKAVHRQTGANMHVEDWFIKKQPDGKWRVEDGQGRAVVIDFPTWNMAFGFVNSVRKQQLGAGQAPIFRHKSTGKEYMQLPSGEIQEVTGYDNAEYTTNPGVNSNPITKQPDIPNPNPPPAGGGGGGGGQAPGGQVPGYNGNFNYQINGRQLQITQGRITKNTLTAADWPAADAAFFKATGLHLPPYASATPGSPGGPPGSGNPFGVVFTQDQTPFVNPASAAGTKLFTASFEGGGWGGFTNTERFVAPLQNAPLPGTGNGGSNGGIPNVPNFPGLPTGFPFSGVQEWIDNLRESINNKINGGGTGTGTGTQSTGNTTSNSSSQNIKFTDANGNNYSFQSDVNTNSNVSGGGAGNLNTLGSANGIPSAEEILSANGMLVDAKNGLVSTNGMIVDGKNSRVILTKNQQTQNNTQTPGGNTTTPPPATGTPGPDEFLTPNGMVDISFITKYPKLARTGSINEPIHLPFRTGQDLAKPFFDTQGPLEHETWAQYGGSPLTQGQTPWGMLGSMLVPSNPNIPPNPGGGNGGGFPGGGNWGNWIVGMMDTMRELLSDVFGSIVLNIFNQNIMDNTKIYETQKRIFGLKQGTMIR